MSGTYDPECEALARHFLQDVPGHTETHVKKLAQAIQEWVEWELEDIEREVRG